MEVFVRSLEGRDNYTRFEIKAMRLLAVNPKTGASYTQKAFSEAVETVLTTVQRWEAGTSAPSRMARWHLKRFYNHVLTPKQRAEVPAKAAELEAEERELAARKRARKEDNDMAPPIRV